MQNPCENSFIFYSNEIFYCGFYNKNTLTASAFDFAFEKSNVVDIFPYPPQSVYNGNGYGLFCCVGESDLFIVGTNGSYDGKLEVVGAKNVKILSNNNSFYVVCSTPGKTLDGGKNFGKNDVWIAKMVI